MYKNLNDELRKGKLSRKNAIRRRRRACEWEHNVNTDETQSKMIFSREIFFNLIKFYRQDFEDGHKSIKQICMHCKNECD